MFEVAEELQQRFVLCTLTVSQAPFGLGFKLTNSKPSVATGLLVHELKSSRLIAFSSNPPNKKMLIVLILFSRCGESVPEAGALKNKPLNSLRPQESGVL